MENYSTVSILLDFFFFALAEKRSKNCILIHQRNLAALRFTSATTADKIHDQNRDQNC
jgi:hypothetical protein